MIHRKETPRLPGQPPSEACPCRWKLYARSSGYELEIPMRYRGTRRARPVCEPQARWLEAEGFGVVDRRGRLPLSEGEALRLGEQLDSLSPPASTAASDSATSDPPWRAALRYGDLERAVARGDLEAARRCSEHLAALAPRWQKARQRRLFLLLYELGDQAAALRELDALPPGVVPEEVTRSMRMSIALQQRDWAAYERLFAEAFAHMEHTPEAWETLGLARWATGHTPEALREFEAGLRDHPGHPDLRRRRAELLYELDRPHEALAVLDDLVADHPNDARARALRGWLRRHPDPEGAAEDYRAALAIDETCVVARVGRGVHRMEAGDLAGARADIEPFRHSGWAGAVQAWERLVACTGEE